MSNLYATGIRPLVDEYLKKKSEEVRDYGEYFSASSAGYCYRYNIMKRLKIPPVPERNDDLARTTRVFESGHIFHEWLQRITREAGLSIAQELELQDEELLIRGHIDDLVLVRKPSTAIKPDTTTIGGDVKEGFYELTQRPQVLNLLDDSHLILYDYKTAHSKAFDYKQDEIGYFHKMQLGTYMYMLRKLKGQTSLGLQNHSLLKELTEARILQVSKDDLRMREQQLLWSDELEQDIRGYWQALKRYWAWYKNTGELPDCTCHDPEKDGGWFARRTKKGKVYSDYFWNEEPCSLEWMEKTRHIWSKK